MTVSSNLDILKDTCVLSSSLLVTCIVVRDPLPLLREISRGQPSSPQAGERLQT
jgi:hypothetical protein